MLTKEEIEKRTDQAVDFFEAGYNCAQSVLLAYADLYGLDNEMAAKMATSFGGGMGRLREVCGAVSGMFMVLGFEYPFIDTKDKASKNENYKKVQETAAEFKASMSSIICADLLSLKREAQHYESADRTKEYYATRPCAQCVAIAAEITGKNITK
ncbi:MAG TPA: C-GCAxxG-C-C family protein [Prolixibacteraceae bacterium]|nr:C-GCAxxG-C-C family protein [Prolixibacteraceae bacterium]